MSATIQTLHEIPSGFRSEVAARTLWQLDDLQRRLMDATRGLSSATLAWQPAPGMNTIGMLLAHIAVAETHMTAIGLDGREHSDVPGVIGIRIEDDGMPLPPDGGPPEALAGKGIEFFHDLLQRARENTRRVASGLGDEDLTRQVVRKRPDGTTRVFDVAWMLYHMVEHVAGHLGQVLLLVHLHESSRRRV